MGRSGEIYRARKLAGLCVRCAAGLQDGDGVLCVECRAQIKAHRATDPKAQAAIRKSAKQWRERNRDRLRQIWKADSRERYEANRADGLCVGCSDTPMPGKVRCLRCHAMHLVRSNRYRASRRAA